MINFLDVVRGVLPKGRAWRIVVDKLLKGFFETMAFVVEGLKASYDTVWLQIFPFETESIDEWEEEFGLVSNLTNKLQRRQRLDAVWKDLGGQSPRYIQDTLQGFGFDVFVHEWFIPGTNTLRNPFLFLNDGTGAVTFLSVSGAATMVSGNVNAVCGTSVEPKGYPLVNKIPTAFQGFICSGNPEAVSGNANAISGRDFGFRFGRKRYIIPTDVDSHHFFWYVGGENFPDLAQVESSRMDEFEDLLLKIAPQQQWIGVLVEYI